MTNTQISLDALNKKADMLQGFYKENSNRNLPRVTALNQASKLCGFENYNTAKACIENQSKLAAKGSGICEGKEHASGVPSQFEINAWDQEEYKGLKGAFTLEKGSEYLCVKLDSSKYPGNEMEIHFEIDQGFPRATVYRSGYEDEPLFSIHNMPSGTHLEYMRSDEEMNHISRVNEAEQSELAMTTFFKYGKQELIRGKKVNAWFVEKQPEEV